MPRFTELIEKVGRNETLTANELNELRQQGEAIDQVLGLVTSWIQAGTTTPFIRNLKAENIFVPSGEIQLGTPAPGQGFDGVRIAEPPVSYDGELWNIVGVNDDELQVGIRASDGKLVFGGGDGFLDRFGLFLTNQQGAVSFQDTEEGDTIAIYSDGANFMVLENSYGGKGVSFLIDTAAHAVMQFDFTEDGLAGRALFKIYEASKGTRINLGDAVFIDSQGASGGFNAISFLESTNTPDNPTQDTQGRMYFRDNKVIFQWNDGGTVRYKYLDLTGTGTTWTHTTSAP